MEARTLQGSSSHLMMFLKLHGQLVPMLEFKSRLLTEINKMKAGTGDFDITNSANAILAHTILQCTLTDADYVYSQRTFPFEGDPGGKHVVASQLWSSYLVSRKETGDWESGGAIAVDVDIGNMMVDYAEMGGEGGVTELPLVKSINQNRECSSTGMFFDELARAIEAMDMRNLLPNTPPKNPIDNDETDTNRLAAICEPLLVALMDSLGLFPPFFFESKGVAITGQEPIFFFGTGPMHRWLATMEAKHGGRCFEMLKAAAVFMTMKLQICFFRCCGRTVTTRSTSTFAPRLTRPRPSTSPSDTRSSGVS